MQSLEDIPDWFAAFFDISTEAAQAILSLVVFLAVLLPTLVLLARSKTNGVFISFVVSFITLAALVGIGWAPFWLLVASIAVLAIGYAMFARDAVLGG